MNNLSIQKTDSTPEIDFELNGDLKITGRSLPEDVHKFYDPLIEWVRNMDAVDVKLELKLEYLNTSSTKKVLNLLIALDENISIKNIEVNWYYEFDDLEMEDLGQIYEEDISRAKFNYIEGIDIF
ncbi:MAG: DUF1987 domain-containing protein [Bacteroidales bacterium]|nr:DUF1987 domain-containing protein [Bacteroidales bacterium]